MAARVAEHRLPGGWTWGKLSFCDDGRSAHTRFSVRDPRGRCDSRAAPDRQTESLGTVRSGASSPHAHSPASLPLRRTSWQPDSHAGTTQPTNPAPCRRPAEAVASPVRRNDAATDAYCLPWFAVSSILLLRLAGQFISGRAVVRIDLSPCDCAAIEARPAQRRRSKLGIDGRSSSDCSDDVRSPVIWCWSRRADSPDSRGLTGRTESLDWMEHRLPRAGPLEAPRPRQRALRRADGLRPAVAAAAVVGPQAAHGPERRGVRRLGPCLRAGRHRLREDAAGPGPAGLRRPRARRRCRQIGSELRAFAGSWQANAPIHTAVCAGPWRSWP